MIRRLLNFLFRKGDEDKYVTYTVTTIRKEGDRKYIAIFHDKKYAEEYLETVDKDYFDEYYITKDG